MLLRCYSDRYLINDQPRLHEFLRRRARLQRVDEAVRRNVVIGFFDTVYWARKFRNHLNSRHAGRMTDIPQFTVPEIFVDDGTTHDNIVSPFDGEDMHRFPPPSPSLGSSAPSSPRPGAMTPPSGSELGEPSHYGHGLRSQASISSIQATPTGSPVGTRGGNPFFDHDQPRHQHQKTGSNVSEDWHIAAAMAGVISRPVSPLAVESAEQGARSRANSSVSAQDALGVLEDSPWGESIRKSFSMRRPDGDGGGGTHGRGPSRS